MNIFVGRLSYETQENELKALFEQIGPVRSAKIITDRETGKSKGFAFVTMVNRADGEKALQQLNGASLNGRNIAISEAEDRRGGDKKPGAPNRNTQRSNDFRPRTDEKREPRAPREKDDSQDGSDSSSSSSPSEWSGDSAREASRKNKSKKKEKSKHGRSDDDSFNRKKKMMPKQKKNNRGWEDDLDDFSDFNYS